MATGAVFKDLLPAPHETEPDKEETFTTLTDKPTESHALAMEAATGIQNAEGEVKKGAAQAEHEADVVDLGWNEPETAVPKPLVGGLSNEDLWILVRRFNKVCID